MSKLPGLHTRLLTPRSMFSDPGRSPPFMEPAPVVSSEPKRRRIWDLSSNFHCSIVGTCLTTAELRHILIKILPPWKEAEAEHDHGDGAAMLPEPAAGD